MDVKELRTISKDIKNKVHGNYYLADIITKGVAYHIGYLPSTLRISIEERKEFEKFISDNVEI